MAAKLRDRIKKHSFQWYTAIILTAVLLVVLFVSVISYSYFARKLTEDFNNTNRLIVQAIREEHEKDIQAIHNVVIQISLSDGTDFLLSEKPAYALKMERQLYQYNFGDNFFGLIYYYYQKDNFLYNYSTSVEKNTFLNKRFVLSEDRERFEEILNNKLTSLAVLPEQEVSGDWIYTYGTSGKNALYILPCIPRYQSEVIFVVDAPYFDILLQPENDDSRANAVFYRGEMISFRSNNALTKDEIRAAAANCTENVQKKVSVNGSSYLLTMQYDRFGMGYMSLQALSQTGSLPNGLILFLLGLCLTALIIFLMIFLFNKNMHSRVLSLTRMVAPEKGEGTIDSGLQQVETGIQNLIIENREYKDRSSTLGRVQFVRNFLCNAFQDEEEIEEAAAYAGISLKNRLFVVAFSGAIGEEETFYTGISEMIRKSGTVDGYGTNVINNNQYIYLIFGDTAADLEKTAEMILKYGTARLDSFVIAVSAVHTGLQHGYRAYQEANEAFFARFFFNEKTVIRYEDIKTEERAPIMSRNYLANLKRALHEEKSPENVHIVIDSICKQIYSDRMFMPLAQNIFNDIIWLLMDEWKDGESDWQEVYNDYVFSRCLTVQDFNILLKRICDEIIARNRSEPEFSPMISEAIDYIRQHYSDVEFNVTALADHLGISPPRLAQEFRNEIDTTPKDYIMFVRIEKAKELLGDTDMLVKDVCKAVGYEDVHVFMKRFKAYTGKTPGQFREEQTQ